MVPNRYNKNGSFWWEHAKDMTFIVKENNPVV